MRTSGMPKVEGCKGGKIHGHKIHASHDIYHIFAETTNDGKAVEGFETIHFCNKCGKYAQQQCRKLRHKCCPISTGTKATPLYILQRLQNGDHPTRDFWMGKPRRGYSDPKAPVSSHAATASGHAVTTTTSEPLSPSVSVQQGVRSQGVPPIVHWEDPEWDFDAACAEQGSSNPLGLCLEEPAEELDDLFGLQ